MYGLIKKNTAQYIVFPLVDADGDFVTGATITGILNYWEDGTAPQASFSALTNAEVEIGATGVYRVLLTAGETNHGYITVMFTSATSKPQLLLFRTTTGDPLSLSVHTPADVWSVGTKVITGGVLTTPADYKADVTNLDAAITTRAPANEYDTELDANISTRAVPNEYDTVIAALQSDLDDPAQYKANVTDMATNTNVDANETKIDTLTTNVGNLNNLSSANIQTVLETNDLDHLVKIAHPTGDPVADSIMDLIMNKDAGQTFARANDSLQGISEGAAGGGASAQEIWEYASPRTLTTPADYKATGFSTHSADDIWTVVSRIITGGVLTTPADYKATGFSVPNEYDTVIATLALEATVAALNNITAASVWAEAVKVITGGVLTTPADYKATGFATSTALTTHDGKLDTLDAIVDIMVTNILRLKGLNGEFIVAEYTFTGDDNTKIGFWQYDTEGNFNTHNKSTGLIGSWEVNTSFTSNKPTTLKSKRLS